MALGIQPIKCSGYDPKSAHSEASFLILDNEETMEILTLELAQKYGQRTIFRISNGSRELLYTDHIQSSFSQSFAWWRGRSSRIGGVVGEINH